MSKKNIQWLYRELPELIRKGVLSAQSAEQLRQYYGNVENRSGRSIALILFGILGALLIGSGVILLLAHNWNDLSRPVRTVLALAPLIMAQLMAGWTIRRREESVAWREGSATFLTLMVGASIALVSQSYHIAGDMANFLLSWMLLSVPLVYLLRASLPALLYLAGITAWTGYAQNQGGHAVLFWPMVALIAPHICQAGKKDLYAIRPILLSWAISFCLCVAAGITLEKVLPGLWIVLYGGLFAVLYLIGGLWFREAPTFWRRPFQSVGTAGIVGLSLLLTFKWPWMNIGWAYYRAEGGFPGFAELPEYFITGILLIVAVYLLVACVRRGTIAALLFGMTPWLTVIGYLLSGFGASIVFPMILFNFYLFMLGVGTMVIGIRSGFIGVVNGGMFILVLLILARFFDSTLGFVVRGTVFIIIGIGFLTINLLLIRRRGLVP